MTQVTHGCIFVGICRCLDLFIQIRIEEVDVVFGDSAFLKLDNYTKVWLLEILNPRKETQLKGFEAEKKAALQEAYETYASNGFSIF